MHRVVILFALAACRMNFEPLGTDASVSPATTDASADGCPAGASCLVAEPGVNFHATCTPGVACVVDCAQSSGCIVECNGASTCAVACTAAGCAVHDCARATCAVECATGVLYTFGDTTTCSQ